MEYTLKYFDYHVPPDVEVRMIEESALGCLHQAEYFAQASGPVRLEYLLPIPKQVRIIDNQGKPESTPLGGYWR
jgi:hypothetical protein